MWWRDAVVYQVHLRGFADGDGDGVGDLAGLRERLDHLVDLGVDALWIGPWFPSPWADNGYDVADYRGIEPVFGTLEEARALVDDAHQRGLRVILDMVANHTSDQHPWFQAALAAGPGSPERARYHFRDGDEPPTDWCSAFGGPAWNRVADGQWYLHLFAPEQPDLNWDNPEVAAEFDDILRFWLDFGIDGLRVDAAPAFAKDPGFGSFPHAPFETSTWTGSPFWDVDAVHEILRRFRTIADEYDERLLIAEAIVNGPERLARYVEPGSLHQAFTIDFLKAPWDAEALRSTIDGSLAALAPVGALPTWVLSNHDETRHVTRYGRADTAARIPGAPGAGPSDLELGTRRARAAALLMLALPGGAYVYQGEELGLWDVEDLPDAVLEDPLWRRSGFTVRGRDGCRVPLPWSGDTPPFGFGAPPRLPQPPAWAGLTIERQRSDAGSMLALYRSALALRRGFDMQAALRWNAADPGVLDFVVDRLRCVVNLGGSAVEFAGEVLLASGPLDGRRLPPDAAVWLRP